MVILILKAYQKFSCKSHKLFSWQVINASGFVASLHHYGTPPAQSSYFFISRELSAEQTSLLQA